MHDKLNTTNFRHYEKMTEKINDKMYIIHGNVINSY